MTKLVGGIIIGVLLSVAQLVAAQPCPPGCTCAPPVCAPPPLLFECEGGTQPHFLLALTDGLTESQHPASFNVNGLAGTTSFGNSGVFSFFIGTSKASTKYDTAAGGECVGTSGVSYVGFPTFVVVDGRALQVSGRNPLYCREPTRDLICFTVKGQVGPPFPAGLSCAPTHAVAVCGVVS